VREQRVQAIDSVKKLDALLLAAIDTQNIDDLDIRAGASAGAGNQASPYVARNIR